MILPSLSCQASCKYCFGPHRGSMMDGRTALETARFVRTITDECGDRRVRIVFHGGEPLLAPHSVWKTLLEALRERTQGMELQLSLQSNLWALDDEMLALFMEHGVSIGTSLDGPKPLCDENRGEGYFERTMAGVEKARAAGQRVSAIATLTRQTLPHAGEIARYFRDRGMPLVLHGAVKGLDAQESPFALNPDEYADGLIGLFPWYIENRKLMDISTLDNFCRGAVLGDPGVCTLRDCSRMFLAISPTGDITSCQRMAGKPEFKMGSVFDRPTLAQLYDSPAARRIAERERQVSERCRDCAWLPVCHGGCYYNALSSGDGVIDPLCLAYRKIYDFLEKRLEEEIAQPENLRAIAERPPKPWEHPLFRKGAYISLAGDIHPSRMAENARSILAAHALGKFRDDLEAAQWLYRERVCGDPQSTCKVLRQMRRQLEHRQLRYNNCYLHVTLRCNERCTHCYASAGEGPEMPLEAFASLSEQAIERGFRQIVVTGGEPLFRRDRTAFVESCRKLRGYGPNLVLRTNLACDFTDDELLAISDAFDQVVVSVDGNEQTHDARRGKGTYRSAVHNCERYAALTQHAAGVGELSLACVMNADAINGAPGRSVQALGDRLGVKRLRFRPLLPLGRAAGMDEPVICEGLGQHVCPSERLRAPFRPMSSCGIGQNLCVFPDGACYPCYAWRTPASYLGNIIESGMEAILDGPRFTRLRACTVDTIEKCRDCEYRYLCGGACRAWGNQDEIDPNTAPPACDHLKNRASDWLRTAREYLKT